MSGKALMYGQGLAVAAGLCAALASTCGKLAVASQETISVCTFLLQFLMHTDSTEAGFSTEKQICESVSLYVRVLFFGSLFIFNALMWTLFVKSLQHCTSSVTATVTNTASNFFFTAVLSKVLFAEMLSLTWWLGASIIVLGLLLIYHANQSSKEKQS